MYLFLISKASYRYFPSHVKHRLSSLLNKNDHIRCMSRERNLLYLASILLYSCLRSPSYNRQWSKRWRSSLKTKHTLHSRSCTGTNFILTICYKCIMNSVLLLVITRHFCCYMIWSTGQARGRSYADPSAVHYGIVVFISYRDIQLKNIDIYL